MNILVCFTTVPEVEMLTDEDWVIDNNLQIDTSFLKPTLNSYDESAVEIALTLSDASESVKVPLELTALTIAGSGATTILKTLNALRFKRVVRIDSHDDLRFRPMAIASILTQYPSRIFNFWMRPRSLLTWRLSSIKEREVSLKAKALKKKPENYMKRI
jgi:electron transfer flavoprotein alpha/beta subunit